MIEILNIVLPVFLIIGVGYGLGLKNLISEETNSRFSWFVFHVSAPALLFQSAANTPIHEALNLKAIATVYLVSIVTALGIYLVGARLAPSRRGVFAQGAFRSNMVFVGLPVITSAFGDRVLGQISVLIGFTVPIYNFLAVMVLALPHSGGPDNKLDYKKTFTTLALNPLIIASAAGIIVSILPVSLPESVDKALLLIGRIAMPLALIVVGASLDFKKLRIELGPALLVSFVKLAVYPALILAVLTLMGETGESAWAVVMLMACPVAVVSHIMAKEMQGDDKLASAIVIGTTVSSLFTITAWLVLVKWLT